MWRKSLLVAFAAVSMTVVLFGASADFRLVDAAQQGDIQAVLSMVAEEVDLNVAQGDGMTALHWAVYRNDLEMSELLVKAGANIRVVTREEALTPLFLSAGTGNAKLIQLLVDNGADPGSTNSLVTTVLMEAAAS